MEEKKNSINEMNEKEELAEVASSAGEFDERDNLFVMHDGEPLRVRRRLESSRRSGAYYNIAPEGAWGLNESPYNPLFEVVSSKFYYLKVVNPLLRELAVGDIAGITTVYPRSQRENVERFLSTFTQPVVLAVGWCAFMGYEPHRLCEFFIFDRSHSRDLFEERKKMVEKVEELFSSAEEFPIQGHLLGARASLPQGFSLEGWSTEHSVVIFNHAVSMCSVGGALRVLPCNNRRYIVSTSEGGASLLVVSYDHEGERLLLYHGEVMKLVHPFPERVMTD